MICVILSRQTESLICRYVNDLNCCDYTCDMINLNCKSWVCRMIETVICRGANDC